MRTNHSKRSSTLSQTETLLIREHKTELLKLMSKTGVLDRDILVRKFFQDMLNEEIARDMGLIKQVVDDRICTALKQLIATTESKSN